MALDWKLALHKLHCAAEIGEIRAERYYLRLAVAAFETGFQVFSVLSRRFTPL